MANVRKSKKPKISVNVITNVPDAKAGSIPNLVKIIGINAPKKDPKIKFNNNAILIM